MNRNSMCFTGFICISAQGAIKEQAEMSLVTLLKLRMNLQEN